jgi:metal-dependent amidase/aminoacylase/carboxypeptidase family protein
LIAIASLSAALAVGAVIEGHGLSGKVILFGTPADEGGGGKIKLVEAGAHKDCDTDVSLMAHPGNIADRALVSTSAVTLFKVEYFEKAAHATANLWQGVS